MPRYTLPLIRNMNRVSRKTIHILSRSPNRPIQRYLDLLATFATFASAFNIELLRTRPYFFGSWSWTWFRQTLRREEEERKVRERRKAQEKLEREETERRAEEEVNLGLMEEQIRAYEGREYLDAC